jgi:hypothetical protein
MATVTITLKKICKANNHVRLTVAYGTKEKNIDTSVSDILENTIDLDDIEAFTRVALAIWKQGKTLSQIRSGLNAGFEVTV